MQQRPASSPHQGSASRDRMGNPLSESDFNGNVTQILYNSLYLPAEVTDPAGKVTKTDYYKTGRVKSVTDRRGILTENAYDDLHRLQTVTRTGQRLETRLHDKAGNVRVVTDANGNRTEHVYDGRRFLTETSHPDGTSVKRTYDGIGSLLTLTDEEGKVTTYAYDRENREISAKFAGEVTRKTYNAVGNLTSVIRPEGNARRNGYDPFGRLISVTDDPGGLNLVTRYEHDDNDNLRHQHGPLGSHTEYAYDGLNRKRSHIQHSASGNSVTGFNEYDGEGNLLKMTDANGNVFTYKYDALGRRTDVYRPDADLPYLSVTHVRTVYDPNDNVVSVTENKSGVDGPVTDTTVSMWDNLDRLESRTQRGVSTDYDYDANGNRTLVATPSGETTYSYDSRNRLKTAVADEETTTCTYTPDGKKGTVSYPNGTESVYAYHPDNRVRTMTNRAAAGEDDGPVISSFEYDYTPNGNRERQVAVQNGAAETTDYAYDRADRLTAFTVTDGADTTLTEYTFDGHNRETETVTKNDTVVRSRTCHHDDTDRITDIEDDTDPDSPKTITYGYDNNGNMTSKSDSSMPTEDMSFVYNSADQLVQAIRGPPESGTVLGLYDYNHAGLRVRHRLSERGDVDYYYDENAVIEERNAGDGSLLAFYRYADRLISLDTGSDKQYYHHDALGSTVNLTDESGGVRVSYVLDPWGHIREQVGESVNRQVFTGQEHDERTGLIYFKRRYYDPDIARFTTQDAYLGELSTPPSLHRYLYAYSNPLVYVDPDGNITLLRDGADALSDFSTWLRARTAEYGDDGLGMTGAAATGVSRAVLMAGEGFLRGVNYAGNWASVGAFGTSWWGPAHAQELAEAHETVANVAVYLADGGVAELFRKGTDTAGRALGGDVAAIGDVAEFAGGFGLGAGAGKGTKLANSGRMAMQTAVGAARHAVPKIAVEFIRPNLSSTFGSGLGGIGELFSIKRIFKKRSAKPQKAIGLEIRTKKGYEIRGNPDDFPRCPNHKVRIYKHTRYPNQMQSSRNVYEGRNLTKRGDKEYMTQYEANHHQGAGLFHSNGVSVTEISDVRDIRFNSYGDHVVIYDIPKEVYENLPKGDSILGEKVFKHNIPDRYRVGIIKK